MVPIITFVLLLFHLTNLSAMVEKNLRVTNPETKGLSAERLLRNRPDQNSPQASRASGRLLHYQLDLNFTQGFINNTPFYSGRQRITWKPEGDSLVVLDAIGLRIDSVLSGSQRLSFDASSTFGKLRITLPAPLRHRDSLFVDIWYAYTGDGRRGYYYYDKNTSSPNPAAWTLERLGYTMTQPNDTPYWFPCIDDPSVKVPCRINVTVPQGYQAASNGLLKRVVDNGDGTVTFFWEERHPIAMYLMVVTISKYSTFSHYYRRTTNPSDSMEIKYYFWQADSAGRTYSAVRAFQNVLNMMSYFESIYGKYPFDKYGMAVVFPFAYGGMEHQTMNTIHRRWIEGDGQQVGIAHELAHEWWGNMVTCATWADIWLNEGFATYSDALWYGHFYGPQAFRNLMASRQSFTSPSWQFPIYNPPAQHLFGAAVYHKGSWVLHMLRYLVGDSTFFNIFRTYRQRFQYKSATTADFISVVNAVAGKDMRWFFDQWVYRKGWPIYAYRWSTTPHGGGFRLNVTIQQHQSEDVFRMPVPLTAKAGAVETTFVANNTARTQAFEFFVPVLPDTVIFDRDGWILKQMSNLPVSVPNDGVGLPKNFALYQNFPNPFNPTTVIRYDCPVEGFVVLKVYDLLGREVGTLVHERQRGGRYEVPFDGRTLTSGIYFYRLTMAPVSGVEPVYMETKRMVLLK